MSNNKWYEEWFNEDYLALYSHHSLEEAQAQVEAAIRLLQLDGSERILDLACGSGRHAICFSQKGWVVVGIDLSPFLLAQAQLMSESLGLVVSFFHRDMRNLAELGHFNLVTSFFTSFGYFDKASEDLQVFEAVHDALKPQGRLLMDLPNPDTLRKQLVAESCERVGTETVVVKRYLEGDRVVKEIRFPHRTYIERVRLYKREELEILCDQANLSVEAWYSDWSGTPWDPLGHRQLLVARRLK